MAGTDHAGRGSGACNPDAGHDVVRVDGMTHHHEAGRTGLRHAGPVPGREGA